MTVTLLISLMSDKRSCRDYAHQIKRSKGYKNTLTVQWMNLLPIVVDILCMLC